MTPFFKTIFSTTVLSASALFGAANASALSLFDDGYAVASLDAPVNEAFYAPQLSSEATIAVARLDGGRLVPMPYEEQIDWTFLNRRVSTSILPMDDLDYIEYLPEHEFNAAETDNKIDEIRLAAANEGVNYVLIYGIGPDAHWSSFGGKALSETGLTVKPDCTAWEQAKAKALLVDSFSGRVLGAVTADEIDYNIGQLADRVGVMINDLTAPRLAEDI